MEKFGHAGPYPTKIHDNAVASMDVLLHATNKQNNSTHTDIGSLFQRTLGMPRHVWPQPTDIAWFK